MIRDDNLCSFRFDLQEVRNDKNDEKDLMDPSMKQISIPNNQDKVYKVYHCDGLLLCVTRLTTDEDYKDRFLVWNPYLGQTRWIRLRNEIHICDAYALGYGYDDNNNRNHKILMFFSDSHNKNASAEVYDFISDSWRVIDVNVDMGELRDLRNFDCGVSLKENAYLLAIKDTTTETGEYCGEDYLVCFDFTTERFGPSLPLPFQPYSSYWLESEIIYWVRDEKLAVFNILHEKFPGEEVCVYEWPDVNEIWISTKIDTDAISWSLFLRLDLSYFDDFGLRGFFIDEEKKVAVFLGLYRLDETETETIGYRMAKIVGEDGYLRSFKMEEVSNDRWESWDKFVCSSYVPSLVQLQINQPDERNEINNSDETKEQTNQPDESKQQINQRDESKEKINQRVKRKEREDHHSVPFPILFLFLALFISSFGFFYSLFGASLN
ncbi:unnamed protein product [Microthlaspi erraticum]|uniref:F-box associated beta-propeller type 1 domain-containing protein n=1 Tax=Microthlaspi erraticum TaxID=1685480 RepID=A0A6D2INH0_9BRAS|nr:unnamed protein product [Microthlaspi erraticum]